MNDHFIAANHTDADAQAAPVNRIAGALDLTTRDLDLAKTANILRPGPPKTVTILSWHAAKLVVF